MAYYVRTWVERKKEAKASTPVVRATINKDRHSDVWRSVQLHIVPATEQPNFGYGNWRIECAELISPRSAVLARAKNDDYATSEFDPDKPVRCLQGRAEGKQRFALEFFIKFKGEDRGQTAKFKVTFSHVTKSARQTVKVTATVPLDAK